MQDAQTAGASPQLLADMQTALDYLGAESIEALTKEQHEVWARSFEAYLREGRAPSVELEGAFRRFRQWLLQIYRQILKLDVELTPEIREGFERSYADASFDTPMMHVPKGTCDAVRFQLEEPTTGAGRYAGGCCKRSYEALSSPPGDG